MKKTFILILLITALTLSTKAQTDSRGWAYSFEVYALASSIDGDASIGRIEGVPVDVGFDSILENLAVCVLLEF